MLWLLWAIHSFNSFYSFTISFAQRTGLFFCHRIWYIRMKNRFNAVNLSIEFLNCLKICKKIRNNLNWLWIGKLSVCSYFDTIHIGIIKHRSTNCAMNAYRTRILMITKKHRLHSTDTVKTSKEYPHQNEGRGKNYVREIQLMRQPKYLKRNLCALINCISSAMDHFKASQ